MTLTFKSLKTLGKVGKQNQYKSSLLYDDFVLKKGQIKLYKHSFIFIQKDKNYFEMLFALLHLCQ